MPPELAEILSDISGVEPDDIQPEMKLREELGFDSLDFVFLCDDLSATDIELSDEDVAGIITVQDIINKYNSAKK